MLDAKPETIKTLVGYEEIGTWYNVHVAAVDTIMMINHF